MAKPANQSGGADWVILPEGTWRMVVGDPTIEEKTNRFKTFQQLTFPLTLTDEEQKRLTSQHGEPPDGKQQSYRVWVRGNEDTAMGYMQAGRYKVAECGLAELMCAAVGEQASSRLRQWMMNGGVPYLTPGASWDEQKAELISWYSWFVDLQVWVRVRHDPDRDDPTKIWTRIHAIMPLGSIPGQPEEAYCRAGIAKVRMMTSEGAAPAPTKEAAAEPDPLEMAVGDNDATPEPEPVPTAVSVQMTPEQLEKYRQLFGAPAA